MRIRLLGKVGCELQVPIRRGVIESSKYTFCALVFCQSTTQSRSRRDGSAIAGTW